MFANVDWGNVFSRAAWTVAEAFVAAFGAVATFSDFDNLKAAAIAGAVAAGAALVSFVKTIIVEIQTS
jgi:hypothetical protein